MANTKVTILNNLVTELQGLSGVRKATRGLLTPSNAREKAPYIGVISGTEEVLVEDASNIRYSLMVDLILLTKKRLGIEKFIDQIKSLIYAPGNPSPLPSPLPDTLAVTIGALQVKFIGQEEVAMIDADEYSSTRIALEIIYVSSKDSF